MPAGKRIKIKTDVVDSDIPLLLSKTAMKSAGVKLDLENDIATTWGNNISLDCTTSGNYYIPLNDDEISLERCYFSDSCNVVKNLTKIHKKFAHPSQLKLKALLIDSNLWNIEYEQILDTIYKNCEICKRFKCTPPRQAVSFSLVKDFNDVVALDLKQSNKTHYILYMIDLITKFTLGCFIKDKQPETIIDSVMKLWIGSGFGAIKKHLADNGGEFASEQNRNLCENLNID